ncbi:hypothetical protein SERLA73DRAFT_78792 [Serpula lacrymans var. lacrymans S7.3]|uniref:Uncharacterized protein n=1 Tax=Serpula lacrymans var. lacrymans (strain S7.3) TaxID=936435 RepID=F8QEC9_SERL3|nr:hypothetical protein SERLA73DRAFT_78792 [Serpula lacrymans var. lacrymans S7.3]
MTSNKSPVPFNGAPPKYLNDFSKALASEVRILLSEVGKLRDERRQLQYEIAELMAVKSKHGAGGEYSPEWPRKPEEPPPPPPASPPPPDDGPPAPARPAWRVVHKRNERRERAAKALPAPAPPPPAPEPTRSDGPAWAQWRHPSSLLIFAALANPMLAPAPVPAPPASPMPPTPAARVGLFGKD